MTLLKKLQDKRPSIIWAETAVLLHDLGKLSKLFLDYRMTWRKTPGAYFNDPHEKEFLKNDALLNDGSKTYKKIKEWFNSDVIVNGEKISIKDIMDHHVEPERSYFRDENSGNNTILKMIKASDGADAALDRNNPLFSAEQEDGPFDCDVFGKEEKIEPYKMECYREALYNKFKVIRLPDGESDLSSYDRVKLLEAIKEQFHKGFADTTRPDNDTSLWEHCYAVASIFKVLMAHEVIYGVPIVKREDVYFGILGIGWDGLSVISAGHKISDIIGRKDLITKLKKYIREQVEYEFSLGNRIYEDDNGIYFIIPQYASDIDLEDSVAGEPNEYSTLLHHLRVNILEKSFESTNGDIFPRFHLINKTPFITHLTKCIAELRRKAAFPLSKPDKKWVDGLKKYWSGVQGKDVCPICRRRPVISENEKYCKPCLKHRIGYFKNKERDESDGTPFISEIVRGGKNGKSGLKRTALIVAKIGLEDWLNGKMIRTLFVTESHGLKKELKELGKTKDFENDENMIREWLEKSNEGNLIEERYNYSRIRNEIDIVNGYQGLTDNDKKQYAENITFLYSQRTKGNNVNKSPSSANSYFKGIKDATIAEYDLKGKNTGYLLYNAICAKTPTPSTVLDVWNSTEDFFHELSEPEKLGLERKKRWTARIEIKIDKNIIHEAKIAGKKAEIVWPESEDRCWITGIEVIKDGDEVIIIKEPSNREVKKGTISDPKKDLPYYPFRSITATPDIFITLVPASNALDITCRIINEYHNRFGKVMGRLPLSIGNIFFPEEMPMFVVLDSGKRMIRNFEKLHREKVLLKVCETDNDFCETGNKQIVFDEIQWPDSRGYIPSRFQWKMPCVLGADSNSGTTLTDYYHPYVIVNKEQDYSARDTYFETVSGNVIHCTDVEIEDVIEIHPSCYDFEFLDSNSRRLDINLGTNYRRKSSVTAFSVKPFLVEELQQKIIHLWNEFAKAGIKDTKLRNLQTLWLTKYQEWHVDSSKRDDEAFKQWEQLIISSIKKELKGMDDVLLIETIESGLFFETLDLYYGIMKEKLEK